MQFNNGPGSTESQVMQQIIQAIDLTNKSGDYGTHISYNKRLKSGKQGPSGRTSAHDLQMKVV